MCLICPDHDRDQPSTHQRERIIFSSLIAMGAKEDDPDLNDVHRALLKWYRADARQQEIIQLLARTA